MNVGRLLLIRHAETDLAGTFCGSSDPAINPAGETQIIDLLEALSQHPIDVVYSSDLRRASMTAQPIADRFAATLKIVPGLREIHFGEWESLTWKEIERRAPVTAQRWLDEFPRLPAPCGESIESFEARVLSTFDTLDTFNRNVAIVAHAGVLRVLLTCRYMLAEEEAWHQTKSYCSVFQCPTREVLHAR